MSSYAIKIRSQESDESYFLRDAASVVTSIFMGAMTRHKDIPEAWVQRVQRKHFDTRKEAESACLALMDHGEGVDVSVYYDPPPYEWTKYSVELPEEGESILVTDGHGDVFQVELEGVQWKFGANNSLEEHERVRVQLQSLPYWCRYEMPNVERAQNAH